MNRTATFLSLGLAFAVIMQAQVTLGSITGSLKDATGAVVPGATVSVSNEQTGISSSTRTQADGVYLVRGLVPGRYSVAVEAPGFKRLTISDLKVDVGTTLTQDLTLQLGQVTESVEVRGQSNLVDTTSGQVGTTVDIGHVLEIPLQDRNVYNLANLVPGAWFQPFGDAPQNAFFGIISLGGSRPLQTIPLIDGVGATQGGAGMQNVDISPPVDSMQEFKVEISSLSAEYGRAGGGLVNGVTKSGTNQYHGSLYDFLRNDKFDAAGWGNDRKPPLRRSIFGGTIAGPILKNRTFFFYNYDGLRNRQGAAVTRDVGLPEWRTGDFSTATRQVGNQAVVVPLYDPETGTGTFGVPRGSQLFPGNIIPASRIDPVAAKAMTYLPSANRAPDNPFTRQGNWQLNRSTAFTRDYHIVRVDQEWTLKFKMYGRYLITKPESNQTPGMAGWGTADPNQQIQVNKRQNVALNFTHLMSPTFFVNYTIGLNRLFNHLTASFCCDPNTNYAQQFGLPNVPGLMFPQFAYGGGLVPMTALGGGQTNRLLAQTTFDYIVALTKIRGRHTFKFGIQLDTFNGNLNNAAGISGQYGFDGHFTRGVDANGAAVANTGINLADFLLGRLNSVSVVYSPTLGVRLQSYAGYFQDDLRVTSNLTLNLGMRYETVTPSYGVADRFNNWDPYQIHPLAGTGDIPAGARGVVTFQNRDGNGKYLFRWDMNNIGPRVGFAYRLFGSSTSVIRGGFGIFYGNETPGGMINQVPIGTNFSYTAANPIPYRLRQGIPPNSLVQVPIGDLTKAFGARGTRFEQSRIDYIDPEHPTPYAQEFNLTLQHQIGPILFEAGYLGNLGRHANTRPMNLNQIPPEMLSRTDLPERLRRPFTAYGSDQANISYVYPTFGLSNYHAFTAKVERRLQKGLGFTVAYTLSKWIDNIRIDSQTGTTWGDSQPMQNIYNRALERALSTDHIPHRLVVAPIVDLPFGKGRRWLNYGGPTNAILGGWEVSLLGTLQKGSPFGSQVLNGGRDIKGDGGPESVLRPNLVKDPNLPSGVQGTPAAAVRGIQWLDLAAFAVPAKFSFGTASRTLPGVHKPGIVNFDSMLAKNFLFAEKWRAQFRWEMFNMTNTPVWGLPATSLGGPNFGIITTASSRRIMQFGLKIYR